MNIGFRWFITRDLPIALSIERRVFYQPWNEDDFRAELRHPDGGGFIAKDERHYLLGYTMYRAEPKQIRVTRFAVAPEYQNRGVGSVMLMRLISKLDKPIARREAVILDVPERCVPMQMLLKNCGFLCVKQERDYLRTDGSKLYTFVYRTVPALARETLVYEE